MSSSPRLLLLSNSTMSGTKYLQFAESTITQFLTPKIKQILFIPFAAVSFDWDQYATKVQEGLPSFNIKSIHKEADYELAVSQAEAICVGGGNTFYLLHHLQRNNLLKAIRRRVLDDGIPYVGWSAGSNVATPNIASTNDMPVIWPQTDEALGFVSYNINAHYNEWSPPNYQGEARKDRLNECVLVRKNPIVAISEGLAILVENGKNTIIAPELNSNDYVRVAKVWLPSTDEKSGYKVVDINFGEDFTPIIS